MLSFDLDKLAKALLLEVLLKDVNNKEEFLENEAPEILKMLDYFLPRGKSLKAKLFKGLSALKLAERNLGDQNGHNILETLMEKKLHEQPFDLINWLMDEAEFQEVCAKRFSRGFDSGFGRGYDYGYKAGCGQADDDETLMLKAEKAVDNYLAPLKKMNQHLDQANSDRGYWKAPSADRVFEDQDEGIW